MSTPNRVFRLAAHALLVLSMATVCGSVALAQADGQQGPPEGPPPGGPGHRGMTVEQRLSHLTKALTLSAEQQAQVKDILTNEKSQMDALMSQQQGDANTPPSREQMRSARQQMRAIHDQTRASITAILDDTQKAKYAEMEQKRRGGRGGGEMQPPPDGNGPGI